MRKFKLVKDYPDSGKLLGETIVFCDNCTEILIEAKDGYSSFYYTLDSCEKFDNWEEVFEKDYEIVKISAKSNHPNIPKDTILEPWVNVNMDYFNIYSVKRLSDGEIFTIKDKIQGSYIEIEIAKIDFSKLHKERLALYPKSGDNHILLSAAKHTIKPLFTTEDKVDIHLGDNYWVYDYGDLQKVFPVGRATVTHSGDGTNRKYFSNEESAIQYKINSEISLSIHDVEKVIFNIVGPDYHKQIVQGLQNLLKI